MSKQRYYRQTDLITKMETRINGKDWLDYYVEKQLNEALSEILGHPGKSAGKAGDKLQQQMNGYTGTAGYNSGQMDSWWSDNKDTLGTVGTGLIGALTSLLGMAHADISAKKAYERQNEFYDNHLSMAAKVGEYNAAGLNPMALGGAGVGATSAPSVDSATTPSMDGVTNVLSSILNYKLGRKQLEVEQEKVGIERENVASQIEYRAEQKLYQSKVNEWFDANQVASIEKMKADTQDALQRVRTGAADELLKTAGIEKTEAEAALIFQEQMEKIWQNSPEWRQVELSLKRAQTSAYSANAKHAYEDIKNLAAQRENLAEDTALKVANTEIGRQQLKNLGLTEEQLKFAIDHQRGDLIWQRVGQVGSALKDLGIGVGSAAAGIKGVPITTREASGARVTKTYDKDGNLIGTSKTTQRTTSSGR